jgi:hypothetical protein
MTSEVGTDLPSSPALPTFRSGSKVGTDLRAVRPSGTGQGEWLFFFMFAGVALSEKSPYLGGAWVRLRLQQ